MRLSRDPADLKPQLTVFDEQLALLKLDASDTNPTRRYNNIRKRRLIMENKRDLLKDLNAGRYGQEILELLLAINELRKEEVKFVREKMDKMLSDLTSKLTKERNALLDICGEIKSKQELLWELSPQTTKKQKITETSLLYFPQYVDKFTGLIQWREKSQYVQYLPSYLSPLFSAIADLIKQHVEEKVFIQDPEIAQKVADINKTFSDYAETFEKRVEAYWRSESNLVSIYNKDSSSPLLQLENDLEASNKEINDIANVQIPDILNKLNEFKLAQAKATAAVIMTEPGVMSWLWSSVGTAAATVTAILPGGSAQSPDEVATLRAESAVSSSSRRAGYGSTN